MITATMTEQDRQSRIHRLTGYIVVTAAYFFSLIGLHAWMG